MKGSYILIIKLKKEELIQIGKLSKIHFKEGFYVYIGSGFNGLDSRINRHLRKNKKKHWHIDYFLDFSEIIKIFYKESKIRLECKIAKVFEKNLFIVPSFGCSDCKCKSHLFYGSYEKMIQTANHINMKQYDIKN